MSEKEILQWEMTNCLYALTLKIQGISFLLAWMTSDSRTELAENSSSLLRIKVCTITSTMYEIFDLNIWASHLNEDLPHLMSMTWLTITPGCAPFPSPSSYRKSLKSHTTAQTLCQPLFTPVGFGIWKRPSELHYKSANKKNSKFVANSVHPDKQTTVEKVVSEPHK